MTDLTEIFARDPLSYTTEGGELRTIIARMREARKGFKLGDAKAGVTKVTAKQAAAMKLADQLDIKGLDL